MNYNPYPWAYSNLPNTSVPISGQTEATYLNWKKTQEYDNVGWFLESYVVEGGYVTKNVKQNDRIDISLTEFVLNNALQQRQSIQGIKLKNPNSTYFVDIYQGDYWVDTSHPSGTPGRDYLTLAIVTTDAIGNVSIIVDKADPRGGFRLKSEYGLFGYLRGIINVKDYGAIGDGKSHPLSEKYSTLQEAQGVYPFATSLTNEIDWASIQKAINDALSSQNNVFIPGGVYMIDSTLTVDRSNQPKRTSIIGDGSDTTIFKYSGSGTCIDFIGSTSGVNDDYLSFQEISGIEFVTTSIVQGTAIKLKQMAMVRLYDLRISGFDLGLYINGVEHSKFELLSFRWNKRAIYATSENLVTYTCPNNLTFISCHIGSNSVYGGLFEYPTVVNFLGGSIENNGTAAGTSGNNDNWGIKFRQSGYQGGVACNLIGVYIESNAGAADVWFENTAWEPTVDNSTVYSVVGCTFNRGVSEHYVINNIRCTFAQESQSELQKLSVVNSSFKAFNTYVPSASRKTILFDGVPQNSKNFEQVGNIFAIELEKPSIHRIAHPHITASKNALQSLPSSNWTKWLIDTQLNAFDFSVLDTINNAIILPFTGLYMISVMVVFDFNATGTRGIRIKKGSDIVGSTTNNSEQEHTLSCCVYGIANESITVELLQTSGNALNVLGANTVYTNVMVTKIADMAL